MVVYMTRYAVEKRARIIELWLEGHPRDTIAHILKISGETVSRHISRFKSSLSPKAADLLESLRSLAFELRKSGKTLPEALSITRLHTKLENMGVNTENVQHFISSSNKTANELGMDAQSYAKAAINLSKLEAETGKNYHEIVKDFEDKVDARDQIAKEIKELEEKKVEAKNQTETEIQQLKEKKAQSQRDLKRQLQESDLTKADLALASTLRDALTPYGFSIKDCAGILKLIEHIKSCKQNPERVLAQLSKIDSLQRSINELNQEKKTTQKELDTLKTNLEEAKQHHSDLLEEMMKLGKQKANIETKILEGTIRLGKIEGELKRLSDEKGLVEKEIEKTENAILMANCLTSALLTKNPINIDVLDGYVSTLKKMKDDPTVDPTTYRLTYEPKIREILKDTLLGVFGDEFVRKEDYLTLRDNLKTKLTEVRHLKNENEQLKKEKDTQAEKVKILEKDKKSIEEEVEKFQEWILREPEIPPRKKTFTEYIFL